MSGLTSMRIIALVLGMSLGIGSIVLHQASYASHLGIGLAAVVILVSLPVCWTCTQLVVSWVATSCRWKARQTLQYTRHELNDTSAPVIFFDRSFSDTAHQLASRIAARYTASFQSPSSDSSDIDLLLLTHSPLASLALLHSSIYLAVASGTSLFFALATPTLFHATIFLRPLLASTRALLFAASSAFTGSPLSLVLQSNASAIANGIDSLLASLAADNPQLRVLVLDLTADPHSTAFGVPSAAHRPSLGQPSASIHTEEDEYEELVADMLDRAAHQQSDLVVYVSGADVLAGAAAGLNLGIDAVVARDALVLAWAKERKVPVVWCLDTAGEQSIEAVDALDASIKNIAYTFGVFDAV